MTDAIELLNQTRDICANANHRVHQLLSNELEVLRAFPSCDSTVETDNVLGLLWSLKSNSFKYEYTVSTEPYTHRNMLSALALLNWTSPFFLLVLAAAVVEPDCNPLSLWESTVSQER